jgi:hypothetical protein
MQHDGKTLKNKPAWKAFIRNRMPECCPVRAVFAWLCCQFCLNSEPLPMPGDDLYLFPGSKEGEMSLANHARIIQAIFDLVGISPPKVTHEFRVFGAQALHDHGVALEVRLSEDVSEHVLGKRGEGGRALQCGTHGGGSLWPGNVMLCGVSMLCVCLSVCVPDTCLCVYII